MVWIQLAQNTVRNERTKFLVLCKTDSLSAGAFKESEVPCKGSYLCEWDSNTLSQCSYDQDPRLI